MSESRVLYQDLPRGLCFVLHKVEIKPESQSTEVKNLASVYCKLLSTVLHWFSSFDKSFASLTGKWGKIAYSQLVLPRVHNSRWELKKSLVQLWSLDSFRLWFDPALKTLFSVLQTYSNQLSFRNWGRDRLLTKSLPCLLFSAQPAHLCAMLGVQQGQYRWEPVDGVPLLWGDCSPILPEWL